MWGSHQQRCSEHGLPQAPHRMLRIQRTLISPLSQLPTNTESLSCFKCLFMVTTDQFQGPYGFKRRRKVKIRGFLFLRTGFITRCKASHQEPGPLLKNGGTALASVAQWIEFWPVNQRVVGRWFDSQLGSIPGLWASRGCWGNHTLMFLSLSPSLPPL